jgi:DNA mismatch repair protein MutL
MSTIRALSPDTIARIAAGEILERPAYAVKELVENALDAHATHIDIDITEGGLGRIAVHDDGHGMDAEDLSLCYLPHTTSKLTDDRLEGIRTMGFRGEALNSIAAVSRLSISSRRPGSESGTRVVVEGGIAEPLAKAGMPVGTSVIVEQLFATTPGRRKFMKSPQSEFRLTLELVTALAMAHPEVGVTLTHNGKRSLALPAGQESFDRIAALVGPRLAEQCIPISRDEEAGSIIGYLAKPLADTAGAKQFIFVNGRHVSHPPIGNRVKQAYGTLLEPRALPVFVLFITVPHQYVDVNVHPRKEQVHFMHERSLLEAIATGVGETLTRHSLTYRNGAEMIRDGGTRTYAAHILKDEVTPWGSKDLDILKKSTDVIQLHNLYLVAETERGILLVDQHAAHERILYEQFSEAFRERRESQGSFALEHAVVFECGPAEAETVREYLTDLRRFGFDIDEFGERSFRIGSVPALLRDRDPVPLLREVLHDLRAGIGLPAVDEASHRMLAYLACRTAIKAGDRLTKEQARDLIRKLAETKTQYTCPHGRPVKAELSLYELERIFRRK